MRYRRLSLIKTEVVLKSATSTFTLSPSFSLIKTEVVLKLLGWKGGN